MALLMGMPPIIVAVMLILNPGFIHPLFADPIGHIFWLRESLCKPSAIS